MAKGKALGTVFSWLRDNLFSRNPATGGTAAGSAIGDALSNPQAQSLMSRFIGSPGRLAASAAVIGGGSVAYDLVDNAVIDPFIDTVNNEVELQKTARERRIEAQNDLVLKQVSLLQTSITNDIEARREALSGDQGYISFWGGGIGSLILSLATRFGFGDWAKEMQDEIQVRKNNIQVAESDISRSLEQMNDLNTLIVDPDPLNHPLYKQFFGEPRAVSDAGSDTPVDPSAPATHVDGTAPGLGLTGPAAAEPGIIDSTIKYVEEFGNNVTGVFTEKDDASYYDDGMVLLRSTGTRLSGWGGSAVGWVGGQLADTYNSTFGNSEAEDLSTKWSDALSVGAEGLATQFYDASDAVQSYVAHDLLGFDELSSVPDTDRERAIAGVGSVAADALAVGGGGVGLIRGGVALSTRALNAFRVAAPAPSATSNANIAGTTARVSGGNAQSIPLEAAAGPAM